MEITLDTNVLRDYLEHREGRDNAFMMLEAHRTGLCDIAVTTRVLGDARSKRSRPQEDLGGDLQNDLEHLLAHYGISEISTVFRLDESGINHLDFLGDESWKEDEQRLLHEIWPGARAGTRKHSRRLRDIDHLLGHRYHGRDVFVTCDRPLLIKAQVLRRDFGIEIASPAEVVDRLRERAASVDTTV